MCIFTEKKSIIDKEVSSQSCFDASLNRHGSKLSKVCPSISAFSPKTMNLQDLVFNEFPIKEQIICNNGKVYLHCSSNHTIKILSAFYGLQKTSYCTNISSAYSLTCFNKDTIEKIKNICNDTNYCLISASTRFFGDPCPGIDKEMIIQYQCLPFKTKLTKSQCKVDTNLRPVCPDSNSTNINQKIWCEPSTLRIKCPIGKVIQILCGFYGIDPNYDCKGTFKSGSEPSYCYSQRSTNQLMSSCTGKQSCMLKGDPNFVLGSNFENVCPGYAKILLVQWNCVDAINPPIEHHQVSYPRMNFCKSSSELECSKVISFFPNLIDKKSIYPIYDQIVCDNSQVVLSCPENLRIFTISSFYGYKNIFGSIECSLSDYDSNKLNNTQCFSISSLKEMKNQCDNKTNCLISVYANRGKDICPNLSKKLIIQYQCMPENEVKQLNDRCMHELDKDNELTFSCGSLVDSSLEIVANNSWSVNITCDIGKKIDFSCGFYGYHPIFKQYLNQTISQTCFGNHFNDFIKEYCESKNSCFFSSDSLDSSDNCFLEKRILFYKYKCIN